MKHLSLIPAIIFAFGIFSCDVIDPPYLEEGGTTPIDTTERRQKLLIEEYTGFKCPNCPPAAEVMHNLEEKYPDNVVLLTVHAGSFANPDANEPYTYDFRTPEGDQLNQYFNIKAYPSGMVNRTERDNRRTLSSAQWEPRLRDLVEMKAPLKLDLEVEYDENSRKVTCDVKMKYFETGTSEHQIGFYIVEDEFLNWQTDQRKTPKDVENYEHNNILRTSINGTFGIPFTGEAILKGDEFEESYEYTIPPNDWTTENLRIIAFVCDAGNEFEILQVEDAYIIERTE